MGRSRYGRSSGSAVATWFRDSVARRRGELKRRATGLPLCVGIASGLAAGFLAPRIDASHQPDRLSAFFAGAIAIIIAIALGLGMVQLSASRRPQRVLRFIDVRLTVVLLAGVAAGAIALIPSLPNAWYRYLFAITVGAGAYGIVAALLVINASVSEQRAAARVARGAAFKRRNDT